jgi:DNA-directed RNA polymerase specialized sigma24 family protein
MKGSDDPSFAVLRELQGSDSPEERHEFFKQLLSLPAGWWGDVPFLRWLDSRALAIAIRRLQDFRLSPSLASKLEWDRISLEVCELFLEKAATIETNPRGWILGVLWNCTSREIKRRWEELSAVELDTTNPNPVDEQVITRLLVEAGYGSSQEEEEDSPELDDEAERNRIAAAIRQAILELPKTLRQTAWLLYMERASRAEVKKLLHINSGLLRVRVLRIHKALYKNLKQKLNPPTDS